MLSLTTVVPVNSDTNMGGTSPSFPTTRPSFVASIETGTPVDRARAEEVLVRAYWKPIYKYVRLRFRKSNEDAKDLTQAFLAHILGKQWVARFDARRGSFRSFLRLSLDGFVSNEQKLQATEKRGGGHRILPLDFDHVEREMSGAEPFASDSVEAWFDTEWRRGLFEDAVAKLDGDLRASGHALRAEIFRRYDLVDSATARPTYADLGRELGVEVTGVTNHLFVARRALREILVERLREETGSEEEFRFELRTLLGGD